MKIAHVSSEYEPAIGGVGQVVKELALRQLKQGHEVHIYAPDWDKSSRIKVKEELIEGIHVHRCYHILRIPPFATIWPSVFPKLLKQKFDVIHSHVFGHVHFVLSALASKLTGAKHINTTHCPWTDAHRSLPARMGILISYGIFSRIAFKFTDKIIAITPWENTYLNKYCSDKNKIENIPNGMSDIFFKKIQKNDFKKRLNIKGPLVLFFGRLNITKGPEKFVEIAKSILKERKDVKFVILGPDEGMLKTVKQKIGNEKNIILLDPIRDRTEIAKMYQASDVYVMPSYREGLPLTLFEAMASGLPIVATPVNGIPFEMKQPENGFLVKYGDNKKFKTRILELLNDKKLRTKISNNNISKSKKYHWDLISKKTLDLYNSKN